MQNKIAYVNIVKIINESSVGVQEQERLNKVKEILVAAELTAQQIYTTMSEEDIQKNRAIDIANINQSWQIEQQNARSVSLKTIVDEVERYRQSKSLDMILSCEFVVSADPVFDVSAEIIERLKEVSIEYGEMPGFTVNSNLAEDKISDVVSSEHHE